MLLILINPLTVDVLHVSHACSGCSISHRQNHQK